MNRNVMGLAFLQNQFDASCFMLQSKICVYEPDVASIQRQAGATFCSFCTPCWGPVEVATK